MRIIFIRTIRVVVGSCLRLDVVDNLLIELFEDTNQLR